MSLSVELASMFPALNLFELKHKVPLITSYAISVRCQTRAVFLSSLPDLHLPLARLYFLLKCNYFTTSLLIQTQLIS